jgi:hypothetical protein
MYTISLKSQIVPVVVILLNCASDALSQRPSSLRDRFLREAPTKWREYRLASKRLDGERLATLNGPGNYDLREKQQIKQNDASALLIEDSDMKWKKIVRKSELVFAQNSRYSFRLERNKETNAWVLTGLVLGAGKGAYLRDQPLGDAIDQYISPHFFLGEFRSMSCFETMTFR